MLEGWKWHMWKWHYFTYDPEVNNGGSACGKFGYQLLGGAPARRVRPFLMAPPEGERVCEQCKATAPMEVVNV